MNKTDGNLCHYGVYINKNLMEENKGDLNAKKNAKSSVLIKRDYFMY